MKLLVADASVVAAALVHKGPEGEWATALLETHTLCAPGHLLVEVANVLCALTLRGELSEPAAQTAHATLCEISFEFFAYTLFADRVWELRSNVRPYDAWYVALAEALGASLATLDLRLVRAGGPRCDFVVAPEIAG